MYSYSCKASSFPPPPCSHSNAVQGARQGHDESGRALPVSLLCGSLESSPKAECSQGAKKIHHWRQAQLLGQPAASPEVVISRASRHQVVDAHGAQLSDAVHPVLSLHQHLQGVGQDGDRSRLLGPSQPCLLTVGHTAGGLRACAHNQPVV